MSNSVPSCIDCTNCVLTLPDVELISALQYKQSEFQHIVLPTANTEKDSARHLGFRQVRHLFIGDAKSGTTGVLPDDRKQELRRYSWCINHGSTSLIGAVCEGNLGKIEKMLAIIELCGRKNPLQQPDLIDRSMGVVFPILPMLAIKRNGATRLIMKYFEAWTETEEGMLFNGLQGSALGWGKKMLKVMFGYLPENNLLVVASSPLEKTGAQDIKVVASSPLEETGAQDIKIHLNTWSGDAKKISDARDYMPKQQVDFVNQFAETAIMLMSSTKPALTFEEAARSRLWELRGNNKITDSPQLSMA